MIPSKMAEQLPDNWIVVQSKSFPDRVYYFNVKTGARRWTKPLNDDSFEEEFQDTKKSRKRKKNVNNDSNVGDKSRATTPESEQPKQSVKRRKLVPRKCRNPHEKPPGETTCQGGSTDSSISDDTKVLPLSNETPAMKEVRLKSLARKLKIAVKAPTMSISEPKVDNENIKDTFKKPEITSSVPKITSIQTGETFTPQMKNIYANLIRKSPNFLLKPTNGPASPSSPKVEPTGFTRTTRSKNSIDAVEYQNVCQTNDVPLTEPKKLETSYPGRKNIAADRMNRLTKDLQTKPKPIKSSIVKEKEKQSVVKNVVKNLRKSTLKIDSLPPVNTNAKSRLERLRNRVASNNNICANKKNDEDSSGKPTTVENCVQNSIQAAFNEDMEWEPIEARILHEIQFVRTYICENNLNLKQPISQTNDLQCLQPTSTNKTLYIVVDTNVFLTNLRKVEELRDTKYKIYGRPVIVVPWTVLRELDYIKDDKSKTQLDNLRQQARKAINFLNEHFSSKHPRVVAQTQDDLLNNRITFETECPDDEILQTCLQIRSSKNTVVLLTFDKNLGNKAMIYDITSIGRNDQLDKLDNLTVDDNNSISSLRNNLESKDNESFVTRELRIADEIFEDAKDVMKTFLTKIVSTEMEGLFDDNWQRHVIIKPPWSIVDVLKCAIKHWMGAVSAAFPRRPESLVKELLQVFGSTTRHNGRKLKEVGGTLEKCGDLIEMVHRDKYCNLLVYTSNQMDELKKKCIRFEKDLSRTRLFNEIQIYQDRNDQEIRANQAFNVFDRIYCYARDVCGTCTEMADKPCNFFYKKPIHSISNEIQTVTAANVHNLLLALSNVLQNTDDLDSNYIGIKKVFEVLVNFTLEILEHHKHQLSEQFDKLTMTDVYYCLKQKEKPLRDGLSQFQELSIHFCKLATYRCT